ncbi:MAG TPA: hypothetical protein VLS89_04100, partial [Candidatus Nanopelagicales bacterium]|nr:hypothetical protein [Candidatus Nanopelagicales bacterium]
MLTLSSLLVQRGVASMRAVEEAIARQVLHGGDLATAVLEIDAVPEVVLTPLFAESLGLLPAAGRLRPASPEALHALPSELAALHRIFPLELRPSAREGSPDTLVIATSEPLPPPVEEDLGFALAVALELRAAPLARIWQAQGEHYGLPVERRIARVTARLDGRTEPS